MKIKKLRWNSLVTLLVCYILFNFASQANAKQLAYEVNSVLENLQQQRRKPGNKNKFKWKDLWIDLAPDTVLATYEGHPLVSVDEFNNRVKTTFAENLFSARYNALLKIIEIKLVADIARENGYKKDPMVIKRVSRAEAEIKSTQQAAQYLNEISDAEIRQYYTNHIEKFREPDPGTRVSIAVKGTRKEAQVILERVKKGEPFDKFSISKTPLPGIKTPKPVQDAIFHLKPNQITGVVTTPIGFYVAKLIERNPFDHFKVSVIVKNNIQECEQLLKMIDEGKKFESLVAEKEQMLLKLEELPKKVQKIVPDMELKEVSQPVLTPLGCFVVKLQERWSSAEILTAKLIKVNSAAEGEKILSNLKENVTVDGVEERQIAGFELPKELLEVAKHLKKGEYSGPTKTPLGYYLVKVQKRGRQFYKPFKEIKPKAKKMLMGEAISDKEALKYYNSHRSNYLLRGAEYFLDIILAENLDEGRKIFTALQKAPNVKAKKALFSKYQKGLKRVSAKQLPPQFQNIAFRLKPGQLSDVIATPLGCFILRLNQKVDTAYSPFEDVKNKIKYVLSEQTKQKDKREVQMYLTKAEEEALERAYYRSNVLRNADTVSEEEAEEWWQANKESFTLLGLPGLQGNEIQFEDPKKMLRFKKTNMLLSRYKAMVQGLYKNKDVVINENLLTGDVQ